MTSTIDTLGKAIRHGMVVRAQCSCGNVRDFPASDLMMRFGGGHDPRSIKFRCRRCEPLVSVTPLEKPDASKPKTKPRRTIADVIAEKAAMMVSCHGLQCWHKQELDLNALAARLGLDHGAMHDDLKHLFRCSVCGSRNVGFTFSPDTGAKRR